MPDIYPITKPPIKGAIDLTGHRYGLLTVLEIVGRNHKGRLVWRCACDCGNDYYGTSLTVRHKVGSCGCQENKPIHGHARTPIYHVWWSMNRRCFNAADVGYKNYGGRGIAVCKGWQSVGNFVADMGNPPEGHSIDRVDNNGGYWCGHCAECTENARPKNCRWADWKTQNRNQRSNHHITALGKTMTLVEWVHETGMPKNTIINRLKRGWSEEQAITRPVDVSKRRKSQPTIDPCHLE